ncbi:MAG: type I restriction enzyme endonuclease domain-containing protein [Pseudonocardiaceae bacterium]
MPHGVVGVEALGDAGVAEATNPHLAIEALRKLLNEESTKTTHNNVVRKRPFSERLTELIELAKEVAAEASRGARFSPPLNASPPLGACGTPIDKKLSMPQRSRWW